jgi:NAD(P)-dependent dehydrogenase (short-subunit alcohol dehydrogenase family)
MRLDGKVVVITGAGGGIGSVTAKRCAEEGARVVCADIDGSAAAATAAAIGAAEGDAVSVEVDVATVAGNRTMIEAATELGGLDVLHANAAIQIMGRIEDTGEDDWDALHAVNLRGVYLGIREALPELRKRGGGAIIITASLLGIVGDPDMPAYGAMKGGLRALCRAIATAHGPENIRCNTICPGDVETPMVEDFFAHQPDPEAARDQVTERYPLRRFATPEDVANVVVFLASAEASYINGIDVPVDGGLLARIY